MADQPETDDMSQNDETTDSNVYKDSSSYPIVGIGASAGGLEAFQKFFTALPPDTGMAFVIVQHLDPTHKSMLVDLVKRYTRMQVFQAEDGMAVKPNCIYIIPPNRDMAIKQGTLQLTEPESKRGLRLPIDFFFRSLADDQRAQAICVVLSGTGSDGSLGVKAIKERGGLAIVEDPSSAKYSGMPESAIATGLIDFVLPPADIPVQLAEVAKRIMRGEAHDLQSSQYVRDALQKILVTLRAETGHDFSQYKHNTINRRVERRMTVNKLEHINDYVEFIRHNHGEADILFRELLIGVTSFFRDEDAFNMLETKAIPSLFDNRSHDEPIRVWVTGCATGEEAYSVAILLREYMDRHGVEYQVQIFATDIDSRAINKARQGIYPANIAADISPERLERFFKKENGHYQVKTEIRDMVVCAIQSVIRDPPFSRLDMICCRNVLIYLGPELQRKVIPLFHYALRPGGILFLGTSETLGEFSDLFSLIDRPSKIFRRSFERVPIGARTFDFSSPLLDPKTYPVRMMGNDERMNNRTLTERLLLENFTPVGALINEQNNIIYIHGRLGQYLDLPEGDAELNILRMAAQTLRIPLAATIRRVREQQKEIVHPAVQFTIGEQSNLVDLIVQPVRKPAAMRGLLLVLFRDAEALDVYDHSPYEDDENGDAASRIVELEHELQSTRQYLQTLIEELETTNEELKSTNEELQSSNEELQSTNEELETAKEELQSVNEELVTVNSELQAKIEDLSYTNNDLNNLLSSIQIGIIFADLDLNIRQFNPAASELVNLIETDIGRPLRHIVTNMAYSDLVSDANRVLDTLIPVETEIQTTSHEWYWMRIRPYRTIGNAIEGVVITFSEISEQKRVQDELRTLTRAVEQSANVVIITKLNGEITYVNPTFCELTNYAENDILNKPLRFLFVNDSYQVLENDMWQALKRGEDWLGEVQIRKANDDPNWVRITLSPVFNDQNEIIQYIAIADDITKRKELEKRLQEADLYRTLASNIPGFAVFLYDQDLQLLKAEGTALYEEGLSPAKAEGRKILDVVSENNRSYMKDVYHRALSGELVEFEVEAPNSGKTYAGRALPVRDEQGEIVAGMVISWAFDVPNQM